MFLLRGQLAKAGKALRAGRRACLGLQDCARLALPLVSLGSHLNRLKPQFLICKMGPITTYPH